MQQLIEYTISVTCTGFTRYAVLNPVATHWEQWEGRKAEKMDEVGQCAYSAGPPEVFLTDNDAQLSSRRERDKEEDRKRVSKPICLCPELKLWSSTPLQTVQLTCSEGW